MDEDDFSLVPLFFIEWKRFFLAGEQTWLHGFKHRSCSCSRLYDRDAACVYWFSSSSSISYFVPDCVRINAAVYRSCFRPLP